MDSAFLQSWEIWWCRLSLLSRWPLSYQVGQFRQCSTLQYIWAYRWTPRGCWLSSEDVRGGMFPRSTSIVYDKSNLIQGTTLVWNTTSLRSKMSTSGELCTRMRRRSTFFPPWNGQQCGARLLAKRISQPVARILRKVLPEGSVPRDLDDDGVKICYEKGWLHIEALDAGGGNIICVLPTKLYAK